MIIQQTQCATNSKIVHMHGVFFIEGASMCNNTAWTLGNAKVSYNEIVPTFYTLYKS